MGRIGVLIDNMFEDSEYSKPVAAYKKEKHELVNIVVEDGNFISSRYPADIPAFIKASLDKLKQIGEGYASNQFNIFINLNDAGASGKRQCALS